MEVAESMIFSVEVKYLEKGTKGAPTTFCAWGSDLSARSSEPKTAEGETTESTPSLLFAALSSRLAALMEEHRET